MKVTSLQKTDRGGFKLEPSQFGRKLELVARGCGNFIDGDVVVAEAEVHDTKPEDPRRGVRFVRVRRITTAERDELAKSRNYSRTTSRRTSDVLDGQVIVETVVSLAVHEGHLVLSKTTEKVAKDGLHAMPYFGEEGTEPLVRLWLGKETGSETWVEVERDFARRILTEVLGYDIATERERIRQEQETYRLAREAAEEKAKQQAEHLLATFMAEHPEAQGWLTEQPTLNAMLQEAVKRKLARFVKTVKTGHYASFSKEMDFYDNIWEVTIGGEPIQFTAGGRIEYEHGED